MSTTISSDTLPDSLLTIARLAPAPSLDPIALATLAVLLATAIIYYFTVKATLRSARETRLASQAQLLHSLLAQLHSSDMTISIGVLTTLQEGSPESRLLSLLTTDNSKTAFRLYGWQVRDLAEAGLLDPAITRTAMPFGYATFYKDVLVDDPAADFFLRLHDIK